MHLTREFIKHKKIVIFCADDMHSLTFPEIYPGVRVFNIDENNVSRVLDFRQQNILNDFRRFLHRGDTGVFAEYKGKIVGHQWAQFNKTSRSIVGETGLVLSPRKALIFYGHVAEEMRGKRIHASMKKELYRRLYAEGASHIMTDVAYDNYASLKSNRRINLRELGGMHIFALFSILYIYCCQQKLAILIERERASGILRTLFDRSIPKDRELSSHRN
jgi:hypothetical protein